MDELNRDAINYCGQICNRQVLQLCERTVTVQGKKMLVEIWDFPAAAVACKCHGRIFHDYSRGVREQHVSRQLALALRRLGEIGKTSRLCGNVLGRCAEQHAANKLLLKEKGTLDEIRFSLAYRPKTLQIVEYCDNCKAIFPNL